MKRGILTIVQLCLLAFILNGYSFTPPPYPKVQITNDTEKSAPLVILTMSAEDLSRISKSDYILHHNFSGNSANCFLLQFQGTNSQIGSIEGDYQFYSEKEMPLELACFKDNIAVLVPREKIVAKSSKNSLVKPGFMQFGKYTLDIRYQAEGRRHSCRFDVQYHRNNTPELHGIWELKDVN